MKTIAAIIISFVLATSAFAGQRIVRGSFPVNKIVTMRSMPNESKIDFLIRVGRMMRSYSDQTGFEACGMIAQGEMGYAVVVTTSGSHVGCAVKTLPENMSDTGEMIHSHGPDTTFRVSKIDRRFYGWDPFNDKNIPVMLGTDTEHFSEHDFDNGPGYLAGHDGLYYQNGSDRQQTKVADIPNIR